MNVSLQLKRGWELIAVLFVLAKRSSRFLRYPISSTISFTKPSNLRISVSRPDKDSWFAMAL